MTIHAMAEYLKYKWQAMGRHGTHSPFVYAFVGDVLRDRKSVYNGTQELQGYSWLGVKYAKLFNRIVSHYGYKELLVLPVDKNGINGKYDMLLFRAGHPQEWGQLLDKYFHLLKNDSMVLIPAIHKTVEHTAAWKALNGDARVRMGIDLYGVGLLLFKGEFRERQHFVLAY